MFRRLERLLLDLSVCAIAGLCLLITVSVLLRALFNSGVPDTVVMVRELMVAAIVLPLSAATAARAHIGVEFVSNLMPRKAQAWLIVLGSLAGLIALAPLIYAGWRELAHTWSGGSYFFGQLGLPKWPGRLIFLVGLGVCWLRLLSFVVRDAAIILSGRDLSPILAAHKSTGEH